MDKKSNQSNQSIQNPPAYFKNLPGSWQAMTQKQLRLFYSLAALGWDTDVIKVFLLFKLNDVRILRYIKGGMYLCRRKWYEKPFAMTLEQVRTLLDTFSYIDDFDSSPRLEQVKGCKAVDTILREVAFIDYLNMEMHYQQYMKDRQTHHLVELARLLYRDSKGRAARFHTLKPYQQIATFFWYSFIKKQYARMFAHFLKPAPTETETKPKIKTPAYIDQVNSQIRALTGGDITKEKEIYQSDTLRALTELNLKAKEAKELERQLKRKR